MPGLGPRRHTHLCGSDTYVRKQRHASWPTAPQDSDDRRWDRIFDHGPTFMGTISGCQESQDYIRLILVEYGDSTDPTCHQACEYPDGLMA